MRRILTDKGLTGEKEGRSFPALQWYSFTIRKWLGFVLRTPLHLRADILEG